MRCHCLETQNWEVASWVRTCKTGESRGSRRSTRSKSSRRSTESRRFQEEHEVQKFQEEHEVQKFQEEHEVQKFQEEHDIQEFEEEHMIQCEMMWMVRTQWCPRVPNLPPEPCARQIAEHELTGHAVYRSWCRHCVASKGRAHAHSSREGGELPEIGIDYGFFGRDKEDVLPIFCVC